ncbi:MAG: LysM peptidoglycan-binding domain-containing protein, partial [Candidatus Dadabacteria bacterium]|nr:LysM peptidoglycan-binding domain-containing protein [Candidatus Dadabacteria bacterium]
MKVRECVNAKEDFRMNKHHIMKEGETLYRLSKRYNVSVGELIELNNIADHRDID